MILTTLLRSYQAHRNLGTIASALLVQSPLLLALSESTGSILYLLQDSVATGSIVSCFTMFLNVQLAGLLAETGAAGTKIFILIPGARSRPSLTGSGTRSNPPTVGWSGSSAFRHRLILGFFAM